MAHNDMEVIMYEVLSYMYEFFPAPSFNNSPVLCYNKTDYQIGRKFRDTPVSEIKKAGSKSPDLQTRNARIVFRNL